MATLTYTGFENFVENLPEKVHDLGSDTLKIALTNTLPDAATDTVFGDITEIAAGNGYTTGGAALTVSSSSQSGGTYSLVISTDITWTATGGDIAAFRYAVLYNDTDATKRLIGFWSRSSSYIVEENSSYKLDLAGKTILTLA